jgi:protein-tyrosine kinase
MIQPLEIPRSDSGRELTGTNKHQQRTVAIHSAAAGSVGTTPIGNILVEMGQLDSGHVDAVLAQQKQNDRRFGEIAVGMGMLARVDIDKALAYQFGIDFTPAPEVRGASLALLRGNSDVQAEAFRMLRSQLILRWFHNDPSQRALAVVSHDAGDGRSHVCANLGMQLAQTDEDTLIIDADLRKPSMHHFFGLSNHVGLAQFLSREATQVPICAVPGIPRLHVLTAGTTGAPEEADVQALLERRHFGALLGMLTHRYAHVLIDTPPAAQRSEAVTAAVRANGCLLVTRSKHTRLSDAQQLTELLKRHGVEVLGAVMNER